jgi:hypothetical protein
MMAVLVLDWWTGGVFCVLDSVCSHPHLHSGGRPARHWLRCYLALTLVFPFDLSWPVGYHMLRNVGRSKGSYGIRYCYMQVLG